MKLRISSKMFVGYFVMALLLVIGGIITTVYTYRLQNLTSRILAENVGSLRAAQELEVALFRIRGVTLNYILDGDPVWMTTLASRKADFLSWMDEARKTAHSEQEREVLGQIASLFQLYERDLEEALAVHLSGNSKEATDLLLRSTRQIFDEIYGLCEAFVSTNENDIYLSEGRLRHSHRTVRAAMYGLGVGGIVVGLLIGVVVSRSIINPIYELVLKVKGATGEELVERIGAPEATELEELETQVRGLIDRINRTTADLDRNRQLLVQSEKLATLGRAAAGVAHEVRNPLTAIKMLIFSLQEELAADKDKCEDLDVIQKEIARMERFVQTFLQYSRPPQPSFAPVDLAQLIREVLLLLAPRIRQQDVLLEENYGSHAVKVPVDADQIKQVLVNLILNALSSMPAGGSLRIETSQTTGTTSDPAIIRIVDSGSGIPEHIKETLFEPFVSGREDGIGLGLSVAAQIVEQHGGSIVAANNPKGGAIFTVFLPMHKT